MRLTAERPRRPREPGLMLPTDPVEIALYAALTIAAITIVSAAWVLLRNR
jgi:hypothetical protein